MTIHVSRDLVTLNTVSNIPTTYYGNYFLSCFLRGVVGYTIVGQTNWNLDGVSITRGSGSGGSINQGGSNIYAFSPNGYVVSLSDVNCILAIRSTANSMVNSGLFRVVAVDTVNNWLYINYRSAETPPAETGLAWRLYTDEVTWYNTLNFTGNGGAGGTYSGWGSGASNSRIILQSPSNYQVRIAVENTLDIVGGPSCTVSVGTGGDIRGDFQPGGRHTHILLHYNRRDSIYTRHTVGFWSNGNTNSQGRFFFWGDDETGSVLGVCRNVFSLADTYVHFGLCENEETPLPPQSIQRVFVTGTHTSIGTNNISWLVGNSGGSTRGGLSVGLSNQPISAIYSTYNPLAQNTVFRNSTAAADSPYLNGTELLPVDVIVGTEDNLNATNSISVLNLEGRRLGQAPFFRLGRSNFGFFQVSTDANRSWLHLNDGIYVPWKGLILP